MRDTIRSFALMSLVVVIMWVIGVGILQALALFVKGLAQGLIP